MAKVLATVSGTALKPGISKNRRYYSPKAVAAAVSKAQAQLAEDGMPLSMRSHHAAEDDSTRIVGRVRSITLAEDGSARFTADIADTPHGRTIASLLDTSGGNEPFLKGVSIRGAWDGRVRQERGTDGQPVETSDSLTLWGLDYTATPGVPGASVDTFAWTDGGEKTETTERVLITESVQEAHVTAITEEAPPGDSAATIREAFQRAYPEPPHILEDGLCVTCPAGTAEAAMPMSKRGSGTQGDGGPYADPGYQGDKKQRYQVDTKAHAVAAWRFINQAKNAKAYSAAQLKRIKGRILKALRTFGVSSASEGWVINSAAEIGEALDECYATDCDPQKAGSWSINASNGPVSLCLSSYGMDPAELDVILRAAVDGACAVLAHLDPDMDGDIDVSGAPNADSDGDMGKTGESAEDPDLAESGTDPAPVTETGTTSPAPEPDAAASTTKEGSAVSETTTTTEAAPAQVAATDPKVIQEAVSAALAQDRADRKARAAKKAAKTAQSAESAAGAAVTESEDDRITRLVAEGVKAQLAEAGVTPVAETADEKVARLVKEAVTEQVQKLTESGQGPARKGLVTEHSAARADIEGMPMENGKLTPMEGWSEDENRAVGDVLQSYVLGARAGLPE